MSNHIFSSLDANFLRARLARLRVEDSEPIVLVRVPGLSFPLFPVHEGASGALSCPLCGSPRDANCQTGVSKKPAPDSDDEAEREWMIKEDQANLATMNATETDVEPSPPLSPAITSGDIPSGGIPSRDSIFEALHPKPARPVSPFREGLELKRLQRELEDAQKIAQEESRTCS